MASAGSTPQPYPPRTRTADREEAIRLHTVVAGTRPRGWYTGRTSPHTVDFVSETGGFDCVADTYDDDLPYWRVHAGRQQPRHPLQPLDQ